MDLERRADVFAALGDPLRLAIVEELAVSDRSPQALATALSVRPSLLAFHLDQLERAGVIRRARSSADRRRKYVQLEPDAFDGLTPTAGDAATASAPDRLVFVCTHNSARSQLAAALWRAHHHTPASSAGTEPADAIHPGAVAAAQRAGLALEPATPRLLAPDDRAGSLVTVCDHAHEQLGLDAPHWSIPDPAVENTPAAFDRALHLIRDRILRRNP